LTIYDITLTIDPSMPVWPGDPQVLLERVAKIEDGANANVSQVALSAHTGTHVDAPYHFLGDSPITIDVLPLEVLTGRAYLLHLPDQVDTITQDVLAHLDIPEDVERLLFRTRNSYYWTQNVRDFQTDFVGLDAGAAQFVADRHLKLVGIDYLSIAPYKKSRPTHEILLRNNIVIVEGLNLSAVPQGFYELYCLPMKLGGADGAPARVILVGD
jgi:arylformamidase